MPCFMCELDGIELVAENDLAVALRDSYPVSPGHTLVITRRHVATWFEASRDERHEVLELVGAVKEALDEEPTRVPPFAIAHCWASPSLGNIA